MLVPSFLRGAGFISPLHDTAAELHTSLQLATRLAHAADLLRWCSTQLPPRPCPGADGNSASCLALRPRYRSAASSTHFSLNMSVRRSMATAWLLRDTRSSRACAEKHHTAGKQGHAHWQPSLSGASAARPAQPPSKHHEHAASASPAQP